MPSFTPLTLIASAYAMLKPPEIQAAVSTEEAVKLNAQPILLGEERAGNNEASIPPCYGGYPIDALYNFGSIRDLFATRLTF